MDNNKEINFERSVEVGLSIFGPVEREAITLAQPGSDGSPVSDFDSDADKEKDHATESDHDSASNKDILFERSVEVGLSVFGPVEREAINLAQPGSERRSVPDFERSVEVGLSIFGPVEREAIALAQPGSASNPHIADQEVAEASG